VRADAGKDKPQAQFRVLTVNARTLPDKGRRTVQLDQPQIAKADFPSTSAQQSKAGSEAITRDCADRGPLGVGGPARSAGVDHPGEQPAAKVPLCNAAPQIIFATVPALLVSIDGSRCCLRYRTGRWSAW
jgi:hypothetical protein